MGGCVNRGRICTVSVLALHVMANLTIRKLDDILKAKLRVRAAAHGRSIEEEARDILRQALCPMDETGADLVSRIRQRVEPFGGFELDLPERLPPRKPPTFRGISAANRKRVQ
jgi:antitoxin FitA